MKKLMYTLLVLTYVIVAYLSVYVLPHYYFGAIMGAAGASLGASFKQFKEVQACPDKALSAYFKWDKMTTGILLVVILGLILFVNLLPVSNVQVGMAFLVGLSYSALWNVLHIQFLRKYYFKNA
ncbi:hypothetical protein [Streptococcus parasuis]|uniref:Uncharacterized protein n=1 Tax=Streptococcus parasuis TaxID=1501662 RepID=A0ABV2EPC1_9STRE|nr:hypothetical protein [Streptococcus parasuis]BCP59129.1 hypothetical protein SUT286_04550 [Streptococcus parasuis]